ncbi:hypothetical protein TEA_002726 [Camellia sinensis var. sinensis]|uniref:Proteasome activator complex subunit 4-like HEAT repeat-like domain-containing protein n=1 Tax=Camellia sinensis var. sinensis TaxID=542762 RepID=A0A4S4EQD1_CAMSN|nr:hypothetical protein TEA_002726 [Camellia sinensis var. sinensis]
MRLEALGEDDAVELVEQYRIERREERGAEQTARPRSSTMTMAARPISQVEPDHWHTKADKSTFTVEELEEVRKKYQIPTEISLKVPTSEERASDVYLMEFTLYKKALRGGLRYNLMANRVLLLLAMASSRSDPNSSSKILSETSGHFLKNLRSQLPQMRILAISALNILLKESPYKMPAEERPDFSGDIQVHNKSSIEGALSQIFQEEGFFSETLNCLSHVHIITDSESAASRGNHGNSSFQSLADKSITRFYFDFSSSWPRTPSWISLLGSDTFYSNFARIFKRLFQECGMPVLLALKSALEEFANAKERSKQCVAAEVWAGVLHSDVNGLTEAWDSWMMVQLQNVILAPSVESIPEWSACIRYAVTGKGKYGTNIPVLRQKVMDCLATPLPPTVTTTVVAKRLIKIIKQPNSMKKFK